MMIALPNPDRSFTCTLFWPKTGPDGFDALETEDEILEHFTDGVPGRRPADADARRGLPVQPGRPARHVHADPWQVDGKVGLVGDAAHAILPFFGQGANCGFEDVVELDRCLVRGRRRLDPGAARCTRSAGAPTPRRSPSSRRRTSSRCATRSARGRSSLAQQARARAREGAARHLPVPLRDGLVHDDPLRRGHRARSQAAAAAGRRRGRRGARRGDAGHRASCAG